MSTTESRPALVPDIVSPAFKADPVPASARLRAELAATPAVDRVWAVDASAYFVRPGPRLVDGVEILAGTLHPDAWPAPPDDAARRVELRG